ncbi:hypothetical protein [uncultured Parasphingorhabdus sp.]|uniref:hypothetical protein n=1 Tax=uncultured Parasphingorhabdus sp. TaxID=2709694 RepID=UPI0030DBF59A|tara:strand:- start:4215 stop:5189 length:975 start_codon:yes stop_codon:yes gene_type:complete
MTERKRTGRPSKIEGATQDLAHRELLDEKCVKLGILMDQITDGEIADDDAETELCKITGELKDFEFEPPKPGKNIAAPNTERLKLLDSLAKLQRRSDGEKAIAKWISNVIFETDFEITRVKQQLLHSVKDQRKVFSYQHKLLQKFEVAGITKHNASQISVSDLKAILNKGPENPISNTQADEVVNNEPDNYSVWSDFLDEDHQQYSITPEPISSINNRGLAQNLKYGDYPPYTDLAKYGQPKLLEEFLAAQLLKDKKKLISEICRLWLEENYAKPTSTQLWATKNTWHFLLALKYNFAHEIPDMGRAELPGVEPHKTYLLAVRR